MNENNKNNSIFTGYTNQQPKSITLRNSLIPVGLTNEKFDQLLKDDAFRDKEREEFLPDVKKLIDRKNEEIINEELAKLEESGIIDWSVLLKYREEAKNSTNEEARKSASEEEKRIRKIISNQLKSNEKLSLLFGKKLTDKDGLKASENDLTEREKEALDVYEGFTTHLSALFENRKNYYSDERKSTAIATRIVHENFPRHIDNIKTINKALGCTEFVLALEEYDSTFAIRLRNAFSINGYNSALSQSGIDKYNSLVAEYNEFANNYSQRNNKSLPDNHPLKRKFILLTLHKQIGCNAEKKLIIEKFENDEEVIDAIKSLYIYMKKDINIYGSIRSLCGSEIYDIYDPTHIYFSNRAISDISILFCEYYTKNNINLKEIANIEKWSILEDALQSRWNEEVAGITSKTEREKELKNKEKSEYSLIYLEDALNKIYGSSINNEHIFKFYFKIIIDELVKIEKLYDEPLVRFLEGWNKESLKETDITPVKEWFDNWITISRLLRAFCTSGDVIKDEAFYAIISNLTESLGELYNIYNKVRNYVVGKPYKTEKTQLSFDNSQFMDGWSFDKETDYGAIVLMRDNKYYLGIIVNSKKYKKIKFTDSMVNENDYKKMNYHFFKDVSKMIPKCSTQLKAVKEHFKNSKEDYVVDTKVFRTPFVITYEEFMLNNIEGIKPWQKDFIRKNPDKIDEYTNAVNKWNNFCMRFINTYKNTSIFNFSTLKSIDKYESVDELYHDLDNILYGIDFSYVSEAEINKAIEEDNMLLFQIYNKDFSENHKANSSKNLHTLYFEALFSKENILRNVVQLNGGATLYRREKSIQNPVIHKAGEVLVNKRTKDEKPIPDNVYMDLVHFFNGKMDCVKDIDLVNAYKENVYTSTRKYDIIKDKRYTQTHYQLHTPVTINYTADSMGVNLFNVKVLNTLKESKGVNVIGIDRGERNLLSYVVIDSCGNILEQDTFNVINNMDYQSKLDMREKERDLARKNWKNIENIKELKDGYLSQVIHELIALMMKYNAIVVMEDLNFGFKKGRFKVEKQVYQKFEVALLNKLQYVVTNKKADFSSTEPGTLLNGYQLACPVASVNDIGKQCGFVFYVPAAYTSIIDPRNGFINNFNMKKVNTRESIAAFFGKFDDIFYDEKRDLFGFEFDYKNFATYQTMAKTDWTVYSYGKKYIYSKAARAKKLVDITKKLKELFMFWSIDYKKNLFEEIQNIGTNVDKAAFWRQLLYMFNLIITLRSSANLESGEVIDQIISPIMDENGEFWATPVGKSCQDKYNMLPNDADANGAYNIALKGLYLLQNNIKNGNIPSDGVKSEFYKITHENWLRFMQERKQE